MQNTDQDRQRLLTLYFLTLPEHLAPEAFVDIFAQDVESVLAQIQVGRVAPSTTAYVKAQAA